MSANAPISLPNEELSKVLSKDDEGFTAAIVASIAKANSAIFLLEEREDQTFVTTTRVGRPPVAAVISNEHSFRERFHTPLPKPAVTPRPVTRDPIRVDSGWSGLSDVDLPDDLSPFPDGQPLPSAIIVERPVLPPRSTGEEEDVDVLPEPLTDPVVRFENDEVLPPVAPPARTVRPLEPESFVGEGDPADDAVASAADDEAVVDHVDDELVAAMIEPDMAPITPVQEVITEPEVSELEAPLVAEDPAFDTAVEEDEPVVIEAEPEPDPAPPRPTAPSFSTTDVSPYSDEAVAAALTNRLSADVRVASFGDQWMLEDRVPRFSRGDLRRMKDYVQEQEQPLTDDMLVQDVLGVRPNSVDFDLTRFAVNVRLSREHRDFDFVGTNNQRFWSTNSLPQIGTTRRKPNELGTDYRFLLEEIADPIAPRSISSVDHVVTFFEYYHGLLPYDREMQALLPGPLVADQRTTVLTFEMPQSYTTYLVELRFPTPNRGGFILGLDDFFAENLVPGAFISIHATENDGHYTVEYLPASNQDAKLLELDERRAQRYVFRQITYACEVEDSMLISEERMPNLGGEKPLEDRARRRPESVVAASFERIGDHSDGPGYMASFSDLYAVVNIERPFSERLLRRILDTDETGAFAQDPDRADVYTYVPSNPS